MLKNNNRVVFLVKVWRFREIAVPLQSQKPHRRNGGIGRHEGLKIP